VPSNNPKAEAKQPPRTGGEADTVEWGPEDGPRAGGAATDAGAPLLEPEEIQGLLQAGRVDAVTGVAALINNATVT
jgi:hypothetical protein